MQFLKTAFWVILAVAIALFFKANWNTPPVIEGRVPIKLWDDDLAYIRLPNIMLFFFLLGLLPTWAFARISRWKIRRRLQNAEQALAASTPTPSPLTSTPVAAPNPNAADAPPVSPPAFNTSTSIDVAETKL